MLALVGCGTSGSSSAAAKKDYTQILHDARIRIPAIRQAMIRFIFSFILSFAGWNFSVHSDSI